MNTNTVKSQTRAEVSVALPTSSPLAVKMLTINEAAKTVPGLTKYRIREMCIKGELPCIKAGCKYLICESTLIKYLTDMRGCL